MNWAQDLSASSRLWLPPDYHHGPGLGYWVDSRYMQTLTYDEVHVSRARSSDPGIEPRTFRFQADSANHRAPNDSPGFSILALDKFQKSYLWWGTCKQDQSRWFPWPHQSSIPVEKRSFKKQCLFFSKEQNELAYSEMGSRWLWNIRRPRKRCFRQFRRRSRLRDFRASKRLRRAGPN